MFRIKITVNRWKSLPNSSCRFCRIFAKHLTAACSCQVDGIADIHCAVRTNRHHHHHQQQRQQQYCNSAAHHCCCHAICLNCQFPYYHNFVNSDKINMKWDQSKNTPSWPANRNFGMTDQAIIFKQSDLIRIDNNFSTAHD